MSILKKIFFLSLFIFVLSLLFWGIYKLSFKSISSTSTLATPDKKTPANPISIAPISQVSEEALVAPTLSADGASINYFSRNSKQFMQMDFYGKNQKTLSTQTMPDVSDAFWSIDKSKLILKIGKNNNTPAFYFFDINSSKNTPLKNDLDQVVWQTNANRILYKYYDAGKKERTLNISDPDGSNWTKIADLPYKNLSVAQIPKTGLISFWNSSDAYSQTNLQSMPLVGGTAKTILATGFGTDYLWSPSGNWALVSRTDSQGGSKMELGVMNANGGEYKSLGIPTFITKCVWAADEKNIYYALPGGIPDNSVLPNDYKDNKFKTTDTFWKINIKTGEKTRLVETKDITEQYDASQMFMNKSESLLFFTNKLNGKLYKISL